MDNYHLKYAKTLSKLTLYDCNYFLNTWRNNLREELEGLIYLRNGLKDDSKFFINPELDTRVRNKLLELINKIENIIIKEIECITEFLYEVIRSLLRWRRME
jgi:hypothetical protein